MNGTIELTGDGGETLSLYILETARLCGVDYILAADTPDGDGGCYILKDRSANSEETAIYEIVEDGDELENLLSLFAELLEDVGLSFDN